MSYDPGGTYHHPDGAPIEVPYAPPVLEVKRRLPRWAVGLVACTVGLVVGVSIGTSGSTDDAPAVAAGERAALIAERDQLSEDLAEAQASLAEADELRSEAEAALADAQGRANDAEKPAAVVESAMEEPTTAEAVVEEAATEDAEPTLTISQRNAIGSAESYLSFMVFSRSGLIDQLVYEGFSHSEAEHGVTAVGY